MLKKAKNSDAELIALASRLLKKSLAARIAL